MSDSDDLLGKADAFLKRYHPSPASASDDIPVLTEVVPTAAARPGRGSTAEKSHDGGQLALSEIEHRLRQRVLEAVQPHIASFLNESLRARLDDHLQHALGTLTDQLRADIETMVRETVAKSVESAIAEIRKASQGNRS